MKRTDTPDFPLGYIEPPRRRRWPLWVLLFALLVGVLALGRPRAISGAALDLTKTRGEIPVVRNKDKKILLFNFRAVEPGVLYRSSGFPMNSQAEINGKMRKTPAALADRQFLDFLRQRKIRTVVTLQEDEYFWAVQGYFDWWKKRDKYTVKVVSLPVAKADAYKTDARGALRAASTFIEWMQKRKPSDGAVLIHDDAGKDRVGVVIAAYEMRRNFGKMNEEELWRQVRARYLRSNVLLSRDKELAKWAGKPSECRDRGNGESGNGFVCGEWLDELRPELELLAKL